MSLIRHSGENRNPENSIKNVLRAAELDSGFRRNDEIGHYCSDRTESCQRVASLQEDAIVLPKLAPALEGRT